jgi:archaellum component FlaF (FlaF/FlaG flagellin family)
MGFALIGGQIVFMTLVLIIFSSYVVLLINQQETFAESSQAKASMQQAQSNARLTLLTASYNESTTLSTFIIKNSGSVLFNLTTVDIYWNDNRAERDDGAVTRNIIVDTANSNLVDSGDSFMITHNNNHTDTQVDYTITTDFGGTVTATLET